MALLTKHAQSFEKTAFGFGGLSSVFGRAAPMLGRAASAVGGMFGRAAPAMAGAATAAAPAIRNSAWNVGSHLARGTMGFGAREGATGLMNAAHIAGGIGAVGVPMAAAAMARPQPQPGMNVMASVDGARLAMSKYAGATKLDHILELAGLATLAGAPTYHMTASHKFQEKHPNIGDTIDLAGLGVLAAPVIRALRHGV